MASCTNGRLDQQQHRQCIHARGCRSVSMPFVALGFRTPKILATNTAAKTFLLAHATTRRTPKIAVPFVYSEVMACRNALAMGSVPPRRLPPQWREQGGIHGFPRHSPLAWLWLPVLFCAFLSPLLLDEPLCASNGRRTWCPSPYLPPFWYATGLGEVLPGRSPYLL
jgi:hypothetical protein